jgi:aminopeptidase N
MFKKQKINLLVIFLFIANTSRINLSAAQNFTVLSDHHKIEQQNWIEYIQRYESFNIDSSFDVLFYHLDVELNISSPYISGDVLCRFKIIENSVQSITLNLHHSFSIDSIVGNSTGFSFSNDSVNVTLDKVYNADESAEIRIFYRGIPPIAEGSYCNKGLIYGEHGNNEPVIANLSTPYLAYYWWPCKDGPGDKPDSVYIDITIPDTTINGIPLIATSNGLLQNLVSGRGKNTFQWRHRYPITPYYVMVAISNYIEVQNIYEGNLEESYPLYYYVFQENFSDAQQGTIKLMPDVLDFFSSKFGAYPFRNEKFGMTEIGAIYTAIENQTNIIINNMSIDWFNAALHETSHLWFGCMITCKDWHHGWLNEGFATYCEALWQEHTGGFEAYKSRMDHFTYLSGGTLYLQSISDPFQIFITIIYYKGAWALHMLRGILGDSLFFECLHQYANHPDFMYAEATTEDFKTICESVSGMNLNFFFDQWVYDAYFPVYEYTYYQNPTTFETSVQINQTQSDLGRRAVFEMPIQLKFAFEGGGDTLVTIWNNQETQTFDLTLTEPIYNMEFDPDNWILKQVQTGGVSTGFDNFVLLQNYPNPFNLSTTIKYSTRQSDFVSLKIYNMIGQEIQSLVNEFQNAGEYTVCFDANNLSSGIYFYVLQVGNHFAETKKMTLIK